MSTREGWQWARQWNGRRIASDTREAAYAGLRAGAEAILARSVELTPKDTGQLVATAAVTLSRSQGTAAVHYGTDHAVVVHEKTTLHHTHGQAKFLETALKDRAPDALRAVADQIRPTLQ